MQADSAWDAGQKAMRVVAEVAPALLEVPMLRIDVESIDPNIDRRRPLGA
jgi:hypothetical protein